ncbi:DUF2812 domain-containing protein [Caldalkalibacillus mannanilyticus]|uniref:DUF2812 domain-containing protein n=1 Tax=Caldalkalibacillus mannanilyticus TaxID=1418 RepID=UPI00046AC634|nr:DUF2812 domain-containing protein [Caldalkalibacillus mannanilyticus]
MKKIKLFVDAHKQEKWLNEMLQQGWVCKKVHTLLGIYYFKKADTLDQVIRLDFQTFKSEEMYQQYIQLHEDFGWEHIGGSRWSSLQYWLKPINGLDELYSDNASEKSHLQRLTKSYGESTLLFLILTMIFFKNASQFSSLKSAYFTPGLWDREGTDFLLAFLFETPFALLRFGSPWLVLITGIAFMTTYVKYKKLLDKTA